MTVKVSSIPVLGDVLKELQDDLSVKSTSVSLSIDNNILLLAIKAAKNKVARAASNKAAVFQTLLDIIEICKKHSNSDNVFLCDDADGMTPLHLLISSGDEWCDITERVLLAAPTACDLQNKKGFFPLELAAVQGSFNIFVMLAEYRHPPEAWQRCLQIQSEGELNTFIKKWAPEKILVDGIFPYVDSNYSEWLSTIQEEPKGLSKKKIKSAIQHATQGISITREYIEDASGDSLLHQAYRYEAPIVVETLLEKIADTSLEAINKALSMQNNRNKTPPELSSLEAINEALSMKNDNEKTPSELASWSFADKIQTEVIWPILENPKPMLETPEVSRPRP